MRRECKETCRRKGTCVACVELDTLQWLVSKRLHFGNQPQVCVHTMYNHISRIHMYLYIYLSYITCIHSLDCRSQIDIQGRIAGGASLPRSLAAKTQVPKDPQIECYLFLPLHFFDTQSHYPYKYIYI